MAVTFSRHAHSYPILFNKILNVDIESLSIQEAYSFIENLQNEVLHFDYKKVEKNK